VLCLEEPRLGMAWSLGRLGLGWRRIDTLLCGHYRAEVAPWGKYKIGVWSLIRQRSFGYQIALSVSTKDLTDCPILYRVVDLSKNLSPYRSTGKGAW